MPKIVDKVQKRKDIALSCQNLIYDVGVKKLTVAQVAKTAGIGKGTVYEYFESKDDVIFEIINIHIQKHHEEFLESIKNVKTTREKVFHFFKFVMDDSEENIKHFNGYKEYLSVVLSDENYDMKYFNNTCHLFFREQLKNIINEGISKNELIEQSINFVDGLMHFEKGVVCAKMTQVDFDAKKACKDFVNNLFDNLEVKNDK